MTGSQDCPTTLPSPLRYDELALRVVGTEHNGRILRIQSSKCTIGSAAGCTLRLRAPGIHDVHCLVLRGPGGLAVRSWSADTRLNGHAFDDAHLIPGDRLAVGPVELEILDPGSLPNSRPLAALVPSLSPADTARLKELEEEALAAAAARDALAQRVAEHDEHVARLNAQLAEAERLVEQLRRESAEASPAVIETVSSEELAALQARVESLTKDLAAARAAMAADEAAWQIERTNLATACEQAREELEHFKAATQREHARLTADLEKAAHTATTSVEKQRELREMEVAMTHWRERTEEKSQQIEELETRLAELQSQQSEAATDQLKIRAELEEAARELDAETERLIAKEEALEKKLQAWEAEQLEAATQIADQRTQLEQQAARLASEIADFEAAQQAWQQAQQDVATTERPPVATDFSAERASLDALAEELAARRAELEKEEQRLHQERENLLAEQDALREELATFAQQQATQASAEQTRHDEASPDAEAPVAEADAESEQEPEVPYEAPSASDIIAKLSASGLWKDDVPADSAAVEPQRPEPAWKALVPEVPAQKPSPAPLAEEEDSIEAYMQRLLKRVSGDNEPAPRRFAPDNPAIAGESKPHTAPVATSYAPPEPEVVEEPFDFQTYVPRSAPELTANLAAMRELANSSARKAIDTSSKRLQAKHATSKVVLALGAIGTAIALGWLSMQTHSVLSYYAALSAGVASLLWGMHAGYLCLKARQARLDSDDRE